MNKNFADRSANKQGQAHVVSTYSSGKGRSQNSCPASNKEEIEKLKNLLGSLEQRSSAGTCTLAFSGINFSPYLTKCLR